MPLIWHDLNPKYTPVKQFWCIFPSQNQQNVKFLPEIVIFQELLIAETQNLWHWIWHALNPKYMPFKPFGCIFPSPKFHFCWFWLGKMHPNGLNGMYLGFKACQIQCHRFWVSAISSPEKSQFQAKISHFVDFDWEKCIKIAWLGYT